MNKKKYIITGAPGTGKTTLIHQLKTQGIPAISEVSRDVIEKQQLKGGNAFPWADIESYAHLVYNEILIRLEKYPNAVFTDRSLVDSIAYLKLANKPVPQQFLNFPFTKYYHKTIFFAPLWKTIYKTDPQRPQQYSELAGVSEKIEKVYKQLGFQCIYLPKVSVEKRFKFILTKTNIKPN